MSERLVTLLGAALAVLIILGLLVPTLTVEPIASRPLTTDRGAHGFHALQRWLEQSGISPLSLRRRYTTLPQLVSATGNLLISTLPHATPARSDEIAVFAKWVAQGNTVLLLVAGVTAPPWAATNPGDNTELAQALGFSLTRAPTKPVTHDNPIEKPPASDHASVATGLLPIGRHPLLTDVQNLSGDVQHPAERPLLFAPRDKMRPVVALLRGQLPQTEDLWLGRVGAGRVIVLTDPALFANGHLGEADNARLFNNLLGLVISKGGRVVFDDMHQGVSELYDPRAFARDPRVYVSATFLLGLWLVWVVGHSNRFGAVALSPMAESSAAYARAVGGLLARQLTAREAAIALIAGFERDCQRRNPHLLGAGAASERWTTLPGLPTDALAGLRAAKNILAAGATPNLIELTNHLRLLRIRL